jgi:hypothetical protein
MSRRQSSLSVVVEQRIVAVGDAHRSVLECPSIESVRLLADELTEAGELLDAWLDTRIRRIDERRSAGAGRSVPEFERRAA